MLFSPSQRHATFILAMGLLVVGWLTSFGFMLWQLRENVLVNGQARAIMHARGLEEHLTQVLQGIDVAASNIDPPSAGSSSSDIPEAGRHLATILRSMPFLRSLSLLDERGRIVASSNPDNRGLRVDVGGFFPDANPEAPLLRIGLPWRGRDFSSGQPVSEATPLARDDLAFIPLLRRLPDDGGRYWALAALNPEYFISHYNLMLGATSGHVQVLRYDGWLLLSSKADDAVPSRAAAGAVAESLAQHEQSEMSQILPSGQEVQTAYRASRIFPAVLAVHLDRAALLGEWRAQAGRLALIVLPILFALSVAASLTWRRRLRIAAQQSELESERRLAASVFDASSDAIMLTDPQGVLLSVNSSFERMTGYAATEVLGRNARLLTADMASGGDAHVWEELRQHGHWQGEIVNRRKDGSLFTAWTTLNAVGDDRGQVRHYVGVTVDISERKRVEQMLARHQEELETEVRQRTAELSVATEVAKAASRSKSIFLANMSHELRTPMNAIIGMTELAQHATNEPAVQDYLTKTAQASEHLLGVINDILDISKIEANRLILEQTEFELDAVLVGLDNMVRLKAEDKGLTFLIDTVPQATGLLLRGDPLRVSQILLNLVGNAIKFTEQGMVTLRVGVEKGEPAGAAYFRFEVHDTGIGISAEEQKRLFTAFQQTDDSFSRRFGGTGLGLSISRNLARLMGGDITVHSEPGVGSTFCFTVRLKTAVARPVVVAPVVAQATVREQLQAQFAGTRILLAEDDLFTQEITRTLLERAGLVMDVACNGEQAVAMARETAYALILMDMQMPKLNGVEATRAIRTLPGREHVPILAMTANAFEEDRQACLQAGMNDHVGKPIQSALLLQSVLVWLTRTRAVGATA